MTNELATELDFLQSVQTHYDGVARIKVKVNSLAVRVDGNRVRPTQATLSVTLLLGAPRVVGVELHHPVEIPMFATFDATRDGHMSLDDAFVFLVRSALGKVSKGAEATFVGWPVALTRRELFLRSIEEFTAKPAWPGQGADTV